ncbi:hypothetical protein CXG81DRAFT_27501 [Caulochytrium protostelioides]|uniref:CEP76/DRC7 peptidase-like domain-containing protein n=1 Tax=Caulochytrium protostelioides TaxID=1555241 RepID=A0A4P9X3Y9_9FUNG|nr:hypothetical protein CXG81DRAFT_27501 [Caulochytrium protostelioides]|eukprot:RKO99763.1 hypothetical protein CXG81DRAFT_27501 [Caulochytrium protostelioides]
MLPPRAPSHDLLSPGSKGGPVSSNSAGVNRDTAPRGYPSHGSAGPDDRADGSTTAAATATPSPSPSPLPSTLSSRRPSLHAQAAEGSAATAAAGNPGPPPELKPILKLTPWPMPSAATPTTMTLATAAAPTPLLPRVQSAVLLGGAAAHTPSHAALRPTPSAATLAAVHAFRRSHSTSSGIGGVLASAALSPTRPAVDAVAAAAAAMTATGMLPRMSSAALSATATLHAAEGAGDDAADGAASGMATVGMSPPRTHPAWIEGEWNAWAMPVAKQRRWHAAPLALDPSTVVPVVDDVTITMQRIARAASWSQETQMWREKQREEGIYVARAAVAPPPTRWLGQVARGRIVPLSDAIHDGGHALPDRTGGKGDHVSIPMPTGHDFGDGTPGPPATVDVPPMQNPYVDELGAETRIQYARQWSSTTWEQLAQSMQPPALLVVRMGPFHLTMPSRLVHPQLRLAERLVAFSELLAQRMEAREFDYLWSKIAICRERYTAIRVDIKTAQQAFLALGKPKSRRDRQALHALKAQLRELHHYWATCLDEALELRQLVRENRFFDHRVSEQIQECWQSLLRQQLQDGYVATPLDVTFARKRILPGRDLEEQQRHELYEREQRAILRNAERKRQWKNDQKAWQARKALKELQDDARDDVRGHQFASLARPHHPTPYTIADTPLPPPSAPSAPSLWTRARGRSATVSVATGPSARAAAAPPSQGSRTRSRSGRPQAQANMLNLDGGHDKQRRRRTHSLPAYRPTVIANDDFMKLLQDLGVASAPPPPAALAPLPAVAGAVTPAPLSRTASRAGTAPVDSSAIIDDPPSASVSASSAPAPATPTMPRHRVRSSATRSLLVRTQLVTRPSETALAQEPVAWPAFRDDAFDRDLHRRTIAEQDAMTWHPEILLPRLAWTKPLTPARACPRAEQQRRADALASVFSAALWIDDALVTTTPWRPIDPVTGLINWGAAGATSHPSDPSDPSGDAIPPTPAEPPAVHGARSQAGDFLVGHWLLGMPQQIRVEVRERRLRGMKTRIRVIGATDVAVPPQGHTMHADKLKIPFTRVDDHRRPASASTSSMSLVPAATLSSAGSPSEAMSLPTTATTMKAAVGSAATAGAAADHEPAMHTADAGYVYMGVGWATVSDPTRDGWDSGLAGASEGSVGMIPRYVVSQHRRMTILQLCDWVTQMLCTAAVLSEQRFLPFLRLAEAARAYREQESRHLRAHRVFRLELPDWYSDTTLAVGSGHSPTRARLQQLAMRAQGQRVFKGPCPFEPPASNAAPLSRSAFADAVAAFASPSVPSIPSIAAGPSQHMLLRAASLSSSSHLRSTGGLETTASSPGSLGSTSRLDAHVTRRMPLEVDMDVVQQVRNHLLIQTALRRAHRTVHDYVVEDTPPAFSFRWARLWRAWFAAPVYRPLQPSRMALTAPTSTSRSAAGAAGSLLLADGDVPHINIQVLRGFNLPVRAGEPQATRLMMVGAFYDSRTPTVVADGAFPIWRDTIRLPFPPALAQLAVQGAGDDVARTAAVKDAIYLHLYDERLVALPSTTAHWGTGHVVDGPGRNAAAAAAGDDDNEDDDRIFPAMRGERVWLGTVTIPFTALYEQGRISGIFEVQTAPILPGYTRATTPLSDVDRQLFAHRRETKAPFVSLFITLDPILPRPRALPLVIESHETPSTLKRVETYMQLVQRVTEQAYGTPAQRPAVVGQPHDPRSPLVTLLAGRSVLVMRFVAPTPPPESIVSVADVLRFVAAIPTINAMATYMTTTTLVSNLDQVLDIGAASPLEHAITLCNYMLGLGLPAYVVLGRSVLEGQSAYVAVPQPVVDGAESADGADRPSGTGPAAAAGPAADRTDGVPLRSAAGGRRKPDPRRPAAAQQLFLYAATTGRRYALDDPHCPLRCVYAVFDQSNYWTHLHPLRAIDLVTWQLDDSMQWRAFWSHGAALLDPAPPHDDLYLAPASPSTPATATTGAGVGGRGANASGGDAPPLTVWSVQRPAPFLTEPSPSFLVKLESAIEQRLVTGLETWRGQHPTTWHRGMGRTLKSLLIQYEAAWSRRLDATAADRTMYGPAEDQWADDPDDLDVSARYGPSAAQLAAHPMLRHVTSVAQRHPWTGIAPLRDALMSTEVPIHFGSNIEYALAVYCAGHPGGFVTCWIYVAVFARRLT